MIHGGPFSPNWPLLTLLPFVFLFKFLYIFILFLWSFESDANDHQDQDSLRQSFLHWPLPKANGVGSLISKRGCMKNGYPTTTAKALKRDGLKNEAIRKGQTRVWRNRRWSHGKGEGYCARNYLRCFCRGGAWSALHIQKRFNAVRCRRKFCCEHNRPVPLPFPAHRLNRITGQPWPFPFT